MIFANIKAIVTDIEGTTSSIHFVHRVLFPYAKQHMADFLARRAHEPDIHAQISLIATQMHLQADHPDFLVQINAILQAWMAEDQKIGALKALQGILWAEGYARGEFVTHFYEDALIYLRKWFDDNIFLAVYSSGSVQAQKLLFGHTAAGDIQPWFGAWFDTGVGGKRETISYQNIFNNINNNNNIIIPENILFLSDIAQELDAAKAAGWQTAHLVRDGEMSVDAAHWQCTSFADIGLHEK